MSRPVVRGRVAGVSPAIVAQMAVAGLTATLVDVSTLTMVVALTHLPAGVAAILGCLAGGATSFMLLHSWVFGHRCGGLLRQLLTYLFTVVLAGAFLCGGLVQLGVHEGLPLLATKLLATVATVIVWNYPISIFYVFRREG